MKPRRRLLLAAGLAWLLAGCATAPAPPAAPPPAAAWPTARLGPALEQRLLALDPDDVGAADVREVLAKGSTPRIVALHGGIYPVHLVMDSFARFLVGMGYPERMLRHPGDGRRSHSPYESGLQIAGAIGWYYENEGLMPMLVGHSQGGIQLVKVLYLLAGDGPAEIPVWNPLTDRAEPRTTIVDPHSGRERGVVGLQVGYAAVVGAGGAALLLPNQWEMAGRLRRIPDSVGEFTGFTLGVDLIAWDLPGAGGGYRALGSARVRNVELPADYSHVFVAQTSHLARDPAVRAWIDAYRPGREPAPLPQSSESLNNLLFAAEVWYEIKKHWVLEAQRALRARQLREADGPAPPAVAPASAAMPAAAALAASAAMH
jgi:hypothetical protein